MYQWLITYRSIIREIEFCRFHLTKCQDEYDAWNDAGRRNLGKMHDFHSRIRQMDEIGDEIREVNERIKELERQKEQVIEMLDRFGGHEEKILRMKYIDGMTLQEIADATGYTYGHIRNKHSELMKRIKFIN